MFRKKRKARLRALPYSSQINPYHARQRNRRPSRAFSPKRLKLLGQIPHLTWLVLGTLAILLVLYGMFFSGFFRIQEIRVSTETLQNETLINKMEQSLATLKGKNLLTQKKQEIEVDLLKNFPELAKVEVTKNHPRALEISFTEHPLIANVINESAELKKSVVINAVGTAVRENAENPSLPYIRIYSQEPINTSAPVIESGKLRYILESTIYFEEKFGMRVVEAEYKKTARELHLHTEKGFAIWLDMQSPFDIQLKKLKKALVKLDIYNEPLEYIDLRIAGNNGDKILYKRK